MKNKWLKPLEQLDAQHLGLVGGKACQLAQMHRQGLADLPLTRCLATDAYNAFVDSSGLRERILLEINRKPFKEMRWEEIWDCATRIRHLFLKTPFPGQLETELEREIENTFQGRSVSVRSSAPEEDSSVHSFAGLHESFINLRGTAAVIDHIRKVWASLWSDAALLYRLELNLSAEQSAMAVVIQETVDGISSGVVFTRNPNAESQAVIEAVHGMNQGLVDGTVAPDRWIVARSNGRIIRHEAVPRESFLTVADNGLRLRSLPEKQGAVAPLTESRVKDLFEWAMQIESIQGNPQDIEWTLSEGRFVLLQTRPVSTLRQEDEQDKRGWYLSLHRSYDNLIELRAKIEGRLIPQMVKAAEQMGQTDLKQLDDNQLAEVIQQRWDINHHWVNVYWADFIPFAHGARLFGQVYNDVMRPEDPYEFVGLLARTRMLSIDRNQRLSAMADAVRADPHLARMLEKGKFEDLPRPFLSNWEAFIRDFGDLSCGFTGATQCDQEMSALAGVVLEMASHLPSDRALETRSATTDLKQAYLQRFADDQRQWASDLLDLARASYQLRDDDNIYLGKIEARLAEAVQEGRRRLRLQGETGSGNPYLAKLAALISKLDVPSVKSAPQDTGQTSGERFQARQLVGQPAGPGVVKAAARVIDHPSKLSNFKHGEILVCDAVDPNMTFVIPLAAGVIERRGGMLIHGAIIAREYGLPCVTGVSGVMELVRTGDRLTVDGYLGIVTIDQQVSK